MKHDYGLYIEDILDAIHKIGDFIEGYDPNSFTKDEKTSSAVIQKLEIIGEASKKIPESIRIRYPEIPWSLLKP